MFNHCYIYLPPPFRSKDQSSLLQGWKRTSRCSGKCLYLKRKRKETSLSSSNLASFVPRYLLLQECPLIYLTQPLCLPLTFWLLSICALNKECRVIAPLQAHWELSQFKPVAHETLVPGTLLLFPSSTQRPSSQVASDRVASGGSIWSRSAWIAEFNVLRLVDFLHTRTHTHTHTHGSKTQHVLCVHSNHTYICTYSQNLSHTRRHALNTVPCPALFSMKPSMSQTGIPRFVF